MGLFHYALQEGEEDPPRYAFPQDFLRRTKQGGGLGERAKKSAWLPVFFASNFVRYLHKIEGDIRSIGSPELVIEQFPLKFLLIFPIWPVHAWNIFFEIELACGT